MAQGTGDTFEVQPKQQGTGLAACNSPQHHHFEPVCIALLTAGKFAAWGLSGSWSGESIQADIIEADVMV